MKYKLVNIVKTFFRTLVLVRYSLLTIVLMLALGTLTRFSGSDTASNVLFGGMQTVAAEQLGLSPNLMGAANSSGGVMGKMTPASTAWCRAWWWWPRPRPRCAAFSNAARGCTRR